MTTQNDDMTMTSRRESAKERRRRFFLCLSEFGLVAVCAVVFFTFLVGLIGVYFPSGSALVGDRSGNWMDDFADADDVELRMDGQDLDSTEVYAGEIISMQRRVQRRGAKSLAWSDAQPGDKFVTDDAVQTFARSTALMEVGDDSLLTIGENSLIVFDRDEGDPFAENSDSVMIMVDGEISGSLLAGDGSRTRFGVKLPNTDVTLLSRRPGEEVEFLITVNDDQSATLNMHGGVAQVIARDGRRRTIKANESLTVDSTGTRFRVSKIPPTPRGIGPIDNSVVTYRNVPKEINFNWGAVGRADRYHIVVARDPEFSDRLVDDDVVGTTFTHGALGAGTYYWHVRSRSAWAQSDTSETRVLRIVQDLEAPLLQLDPPADAVMAGAWRLSGRTEPGASVYVDGVQIEHEGGRIDQEIALRRGANIITVKAMDAVGNLNYASLAIFAK